MGIKLNFNSHDEIKNSNCAQYQYVENWDLVKIDGIRNSSKHWDILVASARMDLSIKPKQAFKLNQTQTKSVFYDGHVYIQI